MTDFAKVLTDLKAGLSLFAPALDAVLPSAAPAVVLLSKIVTGVAEAEPRAVALYQQITSPGPDPTAAELAAFVAYEADYQALHDDIAAKLAAG
jgi:hypothetical protein